MMTEISENQIPASVKPNKIESSVVECCQTLGKFDFSGILNKLLANQSLFEQIGPFRKWN